MTKTPRFDDYQRLLGRFYEPLLLLLALGKTRGEHSPSPPDESSRQSIRRRFFNNIAYLCDFTKGGDSTSAIGIEERDDCYNFWVASNQPSSKIRDFVDDILNDVRKLGYEQSLRRGDEQRFTYYCIDFARQRISKEAKMLSNAFKGCIKYLEEQGQPEDVQLVSWIRSFDFQDNRALCERAYEQRKAPEMKQLAARSKTEQGESVLSDRAASFEDARHLLGRLAHHIRAPKQILEDGPRLEELLSQRYFVCQLPLCKSIAPPQADGLTTLESMLVRMLPAKDPNLHKYKEALLNLDHRVKLHDRVIGQYKSKSFQPKVHAEIQVLEYFYENNLNFIDDDRYINCSKPACYCCHLYIRHHPLGIVEPASHKNIYPNWGPPLLPEGAQDPDYPHQLHILNKMLETIRKEALTQISHQSIGPRGHRDTTTGITPTTLAGSDRQIQQVDSIKGKFGYLNISAMKVMTGKAAGKGDKDSGYSDTEKSDTGSSTSSGEQSSQLLSEIEDDSDSDTINGDGDSDRTGGATL
ncbi:hypothetical protein PFICI_13583 [Pestalotiopsis fici W106-1]|uniref:Uncharacterized protein n=1 Tax=Pestalotiopsis fici (strain W106-1 / CGMCC3.15140) TaxID=1229662 RepID=W3WMU6_PESFW|nr:uncharacterized protein PFICI_13583 [Pestalotiopsis fici W106-1]ETS75099.1 hypothetical protein PFICI_13583 [Pestalotiopsis fici W106-1]